MTTKETENSFMSSALSLAHQACDTGEVPIGAVIVCDNAIIASAFNTCEADHDALAHAELKVIREAARVKGNWRLSDCDLYVTLEPCPMCLGALFQARVRRLVFGCADHKRKGVRGEGLGVRNICHQLPTTNYQLSHFPSLHNLTSLTDNNHTVEIVGGVMEKECSEILKLFFKLRRDALPRFAEALRGGE